MNKYEQLIEFIVNEQEDKAKELFHRIVVEKSRDIYESLMDEEDLNEFGGNPVADLADEVSADDEGFESDEDMGGEKGPAEEEAEEEELEDRVMDLESALDDLRAEFDALMSDEEGEGEHNDGDMDPEFGDEEGEEEAIESASVYESDDFDVEVDEEDEDEEVEESAEEDEDDEVIREYVEKVTQPGMKSEGGEVAKGGSASVNKQSIVAGKNDMGGTAANIVKGGNEGGNPASAKKPSNAYTKGQGEISSGNRNVPGGKANSLEKAPAAKRGE